jgi:SAGA-associated factor 29
MYEILDVDDHQKYTLPESHVLPLGQADLFKKLSKGENIYALYPDTTIFYPATIIQAPKRNALSSESIVTVQFINDEDETGSTPSRTVSLKYIVRA